MTCSFKMVIGYGLELPSLVRTLPKAKYISEILRRRNPWQVTEIPLEPSPHQLRVSRSLARWIIIILIILIIIILIAIIIIQVEPSHLVQ